jgi:sulfoxide reductase heme-binding subunit YedZ
VAVQPTPKQFKLVKAALFMLALLPFVRLVVFALTDRLGANPIEFITRNTGDWTLYFLCITLAVTPLRRLSKWNWLIKLRRMLGLFAFFYAAMHFTTFLWFDHFFELDEMLKDVVKRPFITVGFTAFVLLIPLAATSTNGMVKRLGARRWQGLHRAIYLIAPLGILHFWWMKAGKSDFAQPILFGTIVGLLLLMRVYWKLVQLRFAKHQVGTRPT